MHRCRASGYQEPTGTENHDSSAAPSTCGDEVGRSAISPAGILALAAEFSAHAAAHRREQFICVAQVSLIHSRLVAATDDEANTDAYVAMARGYVAALASRAMHEASAKGYEADARVLRSEVVGVLGGGAEMVHA